MIATVTLSFSVSRVVFSYKLFHLLTPAAPTLKPPAGGATLLLVGF